MVAAQLEVSIGQALVWLPAYSFGNGRPLTEVAKDVVGPERRFGVSDQGPRREANAFRNARPASRSEVVA